MQTIVWALIVLLSAVPLYIAVRLLGSRVSFLKVILVNAIVAIITSYLSARKGIFAGFLAFILTIFIYREMFRLKWLKAFFAWLLQLIIIGALAIFASFLGLALVLL